MTPDEFVKEVVKDTDLFTRLVLEAESKQIDKYTGKPKENPSDFVTGFNIGFWLGKVYGEGK